MTREEAIKVFDQLLEAFDQSEHGDYFYDFGDMVCEAANVAIAALREQDSLAKKTSDKKTSDWISVEERLPEKDKDVMCYSNKNGGHMFFGYRGWISGEWMEGGSLHIGDVTHWMPLPEPPEVEG